MKCNKCGTDYEGKFCPKCGTSATGELPPEQTCPKCGTKYSGNFCPNGCNSPAFNSAVQQKPKGKLKGWQIALIVIGAIFVLFIIVGIVGGSSTTTTGADANSTSATVSTNSIATVSNSNSSSQRTDNRYTIGDTLDANGLKITFEKAETWTSDNQFITPKDGYMFIRAYFSAENTSSTDRTIGSIDFDCYVNDIKMDSCYYGDDTLDSIATISAGRKNSGYVYFEIPVSSTEVELEYETSVWTGKKAIFAFTF